MYNLSLHYTGNIQDAEEITQDVFLKVHRSLEGFQQQSSLKTWIYRITINTSLDFIKSKKRKKQLHFIFRALGSGDIDHSKASDFNHPGIQLEQKEGVKRIFNCMEKLPEQQRSVLILIKIEGQTIAETARIMGKTEKSIESILGRAKHNLRELLKQSEGNDSNIRPSN